MGNHRSALIFLLTMMIGLSHCVKQIKVGVIIISDYGAPYDVERSGAAIQLAFDEVNEKLLNADYELVKIEKHYGPRCDASEAPGLASDMYYNEDIVALIGPGCTYALEPVARLAGYWNIPIFTGLGDSGQFKDKNDFPTLTRMAYCQCRLRKVFGSVFAEFGWTSISLVMDRDDDHGLILGETLAVGLQKGGYFPNAIKYYGSENHDLKDILREASAQSRVIVLSVSGETVREFMLAAHDMGYTQSGEFVFLDVELFEFPGDYWGSHGWRRQDDRDQQAKEAYESLLRISLYQPNSTHYEEFSRKVQQKALQMYGFNYTGEQVNFFTGAFYDGVWLYGMSVNESIEAGMDYTDGYNLTRTFTWDRNFIGITDDVFIDDNGDRDTSYAVMDMDASTGEFYVVAYYWGDKPGYTKVPGVEVQWPGGVVPPNEPFCWFKHDNPACKESEPISPVIISLLSLLCVVLVGGIITFYSYRHYKLENELKDMSWIVSSNDIKQRKTNGMNSMRSLMSLKSEISASSSLPGNQVYTDVAVYQGQVVALRHIHKSQIPLNRSILMEVKSRRGLHHNNISKFVGAVIESPKAMLLHEYCPKGSLQDLVANDSINLDSVFKMSLIDDIVSGLSFIHNSSVRTHGRLRSSNCVVDSRFVLKLTDFGLPTFFGNQDLYTEENEHSHYEKLLWRPPEFLRNPMPTQGSQKGDVYSFGIMLEEILTRAGPFEEARITLSTKEIINRVRILEDPPFRPEISKDSIPEDLYQLYMSCLHEEWANRPDLASIKNILKKLKKGKDVNIMDNLLSRMEQYANNLEGIVAERTNMLTQEQKKTEQLLLQILPRSVAEKLKRGLSVEPETYECVTLYFSDIVGFTTISAASNPLQIVDMLNDLYTCFDAIIESYDVYKVETIGDAYMVVSGLPVRNGVNHSAQIAKMSLDLLQAIPKFKVKHMPGEKIKLRIGLHSGSCVAGVVGLKMPRYCLFGDTVNTASRMESHGHPLKIHMSRVTHDLLCQNFDTFDTLERGPIDVKGKGTMMTYWLIGVRQEIEISQV